jgi:hypothetical protein
MGIENCEACGRSLEADNTVIHRIIPEEISREANVLDLRTVALCHSCLKKVSNMTFDPESDIPRFRTPTEMIEEYVATYKFFTRYRRSQ